MSLIEIPNEIIEAPNFIGGEWIKGDGESIDIYSPYNGKVVGRTNESSSKQIDQAIAKAKDAQVLWEKTPLKDRTKVMFNFREILLRDIEKIAHIVSLENGKIISESKAGIMKGIEVLEYAISLQNLDAGSKMEVSRGVFCEYRREALGVVASITPFNFPAMVPMWTIPIAITLGNSYIWKPSEKTPLTATLIGNALTEAGLPAGVLTILNGTANCVNDIIDHKDVAAVGFVGSSKIAKIVYSRATALGKRALCLGGAKNHIILLPDADPEMSGIGIADSFTGCAGQRCMAASVLLAVGEVDKQIESIVERAKSTSLGDKMGAIITKEQLDFLSGAIDKAASEGAKILLDGREAKKPEGDGYWLGPTILDGVKENSEASKVELFGPVMSIIRCSNLSEALRIENANEYGNAASVFTNSGAMAEVVAQNASAGMVGINIGVPVPREPFSFGGINESKFGYGDITGENSLNFWSHVKKVTTKWQMQNDHNWMS
ncbi:malonic semialdehyde oxidative decarboxylase [Halobacteriovorax marinus SJ]|uniref:Malonic semialdehyde oxidative decarboxylase n=1 Tax=Halobacteriovorax marinus (strain ATCC BAA-682 / DSM 15412 / SJ) TaxID=862908 RepID=E1X531_HALMS|nr:aldehyde dehydrogenase family protein [Halobacteriovorax marinus]CBW25502.1 malonic semialdehyde oxidative decarboxylase [Halobacteriovorax marinus SJ]